MTSSATLIDRKGILLYSQNESLIGKNYFGNQFQTVLPYSIKDELNDIIKGSLEGNAGIEDITVERNTTSIAYEPVILNGYYLWTLYVLAPHRLASNVYAVVNQQANFSTIVIILIGALAFGIAFIILSWNKSLKVSVDARTSELKKLLAIHTPCSHHYHNKPHYLNHTCKACDNCNYL